MRELINTKSGYKTKISNEELEWLAEIYLKLQQNKLFKKFSKDFQQFINDYLDEQLKTYLQAKNKDKNKND